jgi:hypothetical protein
MTTIPTQIELKELMTISSDWCISLYMPTYRGGPDGQQNPIRLKKWLKTAEKQLVDSGVRTADAVELVKPAWELLETPGFWREPGDGLALFIAPGLARTYHLPMPIKRLLVVGERFYLKPLLPLVEGNHHFFVLALSLNKIQLLEGSRYDLHPVELRDAPKSMAEALKEDDVEQPIQRFTRADSPGAPGKRASVSYGVGGGVEENAKPNILRYFQQVDKGLRTTLPLNHTPLILAGVDYLIPLYKEANSYPHLVDTPIKGNPERVQTEELHAEAAQILQPYFNRPQAEATDCYNQFAGNGSGLTSTDLLEILQASLAARVETLFVPEDSQQWGTFDPTANKIELSDAPRIGDQDLFDLAAIQTYLSGGTVFVVNPNQVPGEGPLAAIFRY